MSYVNMYLYNTRSTYSLKRYALCPVLSYSAWVRTILGGVPQAKRTSTCYAAEGSVTILAGPPRKGLVTRNIFCVPPTRRIVLSRVFNEPVFDLLITWVEGGGGQLQSFQNHVLIFLEARSLIVSQTFTWGGGATSKCETMPKYTGKRSKWAWHFDCVRVGDVRRRRVNRKNRRVIISNWPNPYEVRSNEKFCGARN